ncbi:MAG: hypothetical protein ACJA0S_001024 [Rickettsiales bacterium]|jgi:hypothetical protein
MNGCIIKIILIIVVLMIVISSLSNITNYFSSNAVEKIQGIKNKANIAKKMLEQATDKK